MRGLFPYILLDIFNLQHVYRQQKYTGRITVAFAHDQIGSIRRDPTGFRCQHERCRSLGAHDLPYLKTTAKMATTSDATLPPRPQSVPLFPRSMSPDLSHFRASPKRVRTPLVRYKIRTTWDETLACKQQCSNHIFVNPLTTVGQNCSAVRSIPTLHCFRDGYIGCNTRLVRQTNLKDDKMFTNWPFSS